MEDEDDVAQGHVSHNTENDNEEGVVGDHGGSNDNPAADMQVDASDATAGDKENKDSICVAEDSRELQTEAIERLKKTVATEKVMGDYVVVSGYFFTEKVLGKCASNFIHMNVLK
jgi:hypothetical protein